MKETPAKATLLTALNLLLFAIVGTAILAFTYSQTHERIAQSVEKEKLQLIMQVVPPALFDNDIIRDTTTLAANVQLGTDAPTTINRGRLHGQPSVAVLETVAPDGYSGKIRMIVAIRADASIAGVRVVEHKETPGLGDYIDYAKNHWISVFDDASHARYKEGDWQVKKDGGQFDYMAGATISPRAVVKAVHKTLHYFEENREQLFAVSTSASGVVPQGDAPKENQQ
jgi:electron transport complex protein RnfG